uniref:Uncharacterized protein n=1 Tax=Romanomermis culicivorax TaxID=13658 RepID=A0A915HVV2_ROMCU
PALLIVYLISQLISILITAAFIIIFSVLSTYFPATNNETLSTSSTIPQKVDHVQDTPMVAGTLPAFGMMILLLVIQIWCFSTVIGAYKYLKDERRVKASHRIENTAQYGRKM